MELETVLKDLKELNPASWTYVDSWKWDYEWSQTMRAPYNGDEALFVRYVTTPMAHTCEGISLRIIKDNVIKFDAETRIPENPKATEPENKLADRLQEVFFEIRSKIPYKNMTSKT